jgi:hypothetical protein
MTEGDLTEEERAELYRMMDAVPFRGNYTDLGEQEEIRLDYLRDKERERQASPSPSAE